MLGDQELEADFSRAVNDATCTSVSHTVVQVLRHVGSLPVEQQGFGLGADLDAFFVYEDFIEALVKGNRFPALRPRGDVDRAIYWVAYCLYREYRARARKYGGKQVRVSVEGVFMFPSDLDDEPSS
eukprot:3579111-Lingulodinium_polyedra.AAC.1